MKINNASEIQISLDKHTISKATYCVEQEDSEEEEDYFYDFFNPFLFLCLSVTLCFIASSTIEDVTGLVIAVTSLIAGISSLVMAVKGKKLTRRRVSTKKKEEKKNEPIGKDTK